MLRVICNLLFTCVYFGGDARHVNATRGAYGCRRLSGADFMSFQRFAYLGEGGKDSCGKKIVYSIVIRHMNKTTAKDTFDMLT